MEIIKLTPRQLRERKFLLLAPCFALPLFTALFWGFGGGKETASTIVMVKGFNTKVPSAHLSKQTDWDKAAIYNKARQDSLAAAEREKMQEGYANRIGLAAPADSTVRMMEEKAEEIRRSMNPAQVFSGSVSGQHGSVPPHGVMEPLDADRRMPGRGVPKESPDIEKLERMMGLLKKGNKEDDPQMDQLSAILDKLIAAQHPGESRDSSRSMDPAAAFRKALAMRLAYPGESLSRMGDTLEVSRNRFYGIGSNDGVTISDQGLAEAIITEGRVIIKGSPVRMELLTDIRIGETVIPRGEPVYGIAGNLGAERMPVTVSSIFYNRQVFPVSLQVLGADGLPGLPIPGTFSREAIRESASQGLNTLGPTSLDPSLGAQAASAGIQVARTLAGRKIRVEKVTVQAGERVYLQDIKH